MQAYKVFISSPRSALIVSASVVIARPARCRLLVVNMTTGFSPPKADSTIGSLTTSPEEPPSKRIHSQSSKIALAAIPISSASHCIKPGPEVFDLEEKGPADNATEHYDDDRGNRNYELYIED